MKNVSRETFHVERFFIPLALITPLHHIRSTSVSYAHMFHVKHFSETFRLTGCYTYRGQYRERDAMSETDATKRYVSRETPGILPALPGIFLHCVQTHLVFEEISQKAKNAV